MRTSTLARCCRGAPRASLIDARNCNVRNDQDLRANTLSAHVVPARVIRARKKKKNGSEPARRARGGSRREFLAGKRLLPCNVTRLPFPNERIKKRCGREAATFSRQVLNNCRSRTCLSRQSLSSALIYPQIPALITAYRDLIKGKVR